MSAQPNAAALVAVDETAASSSKSTSKSKSKNKSKSDKAANAEQLQQYDQEQRRLRSLLAWCEASSERHFAQPNGVVPNLWEEYRELLGKVQELRKAETEQYGETLAQAWNTWGRGSTGPDTLPSRFAAFERWFVQETVAHGGGSAQLAADGKHLDAIEFVFANAEQGNGVIARRDIPAGQTFINVPEALMMTAEKARKSETFQLITSGALDSTELSPAMAKLDNFLLRMFLIVERRRGGNSYWSPYIDLLPQRFRLPLYFTEAELELLKPSPALQEAFVQLRNVVRQYAAWKQYLMMLELARAAELPSGSGDAHQKILDQRRRAQAMPVRYNELTYDLFCWASSAVATRQNQIVVGEVRANQAPELSLALIPGWDMCNHAFGGASSFYDTQTRSLECVAVAPIAKGEPVLLHYGDRSSMAYFGNSEFVPADHPTDQYLILLAVGKQDPLFKSKSTILQALGVKESGRLPLRSTLEESKMLLGFLRVLWMDATEAATFLPGAEGVLRASGGSRTVRTNELRSMLTEVSRPVSAANEAKVLEFLSTRCKLLMTQYKAISQPLPESTPSTAHTDLILALLRTEHDLLAKHVRSTA